MIECRGERMEGMKKVGSKSRKRGVVIECLVVEGKARNGWGRWE